MLALSHFIPPYHTPGGRKKQAAAQRDGAQRGAVVE